MQFFRKIYCRIPGYGQLIHRKGSRTLGKVMIDDAVSYYSILLKGSRRSLFGSSKFYIVLTEHCLEEAIHRGEINDQYTKHPLPFGRYTGIDHIEKAHRAKNTFDCIFLHVYRYVRGGGIVDNIIALSERQFRRAIVRAKQHPELIVKRRWWHTCFEKVFHKACAYASN